MEAIKSIDLCLVVHSKYFFGETVCDVMYSYNHREAGGDGNKVWCMLNLLRIIFVSLKVIKFHRTAEGGKVRAILSSIQCCFLRSC